MTASHFEESHPLLRAWGRVHRERGQRTGGFLPLTHEGEHVGSNFALLARPAACRELNGAWGRIGRKFDAIHSREGIEGSFWVKTPFGSDSIVSRALARSGARLLTCPLKKYALIAGLRHTLVVCCVTSQWLVV